MSTKPHIVAGGGLAGLTAALDLARRGSSVTLLEQTGHLGGRAATLVENGFYLNWGPHALYAGGEAYRTFEEWKIPFSGHAPRLGRRGAFAVHGGRLHRFPATPAALLQTSAFRIVEKPAAALGLRKLLTADPATAHGITAAEWIARHLPSRTVGQFAAALIRVSTYCADLDLMTAEAALRQVQLGARGGVRYLDGGWQTLVEGLRAACEAAGVRIETGAVVARVEPGTIHLSGGRTIAHGGAILAVSPPVCERLTDKPLPNLDPIRAACLDLGLRRPPDGAARFALGMDCSFYLSAHSAWARLIAEGSAPEGATLVHVAKYLRQKERADRRELEAFADLAMPGWRNELLTARFLPEMTVSHAVAARQGRPDVDALGMDDVRIAGDWVGPEGMLADAAVSSARRAVRSLLQRRAVAA
jgi:phytoene dehydrogenase-like protein